jgi:hypothetical protein
MRGLEATNAMRRKGLNTGIEEETWVGVLRGVW